MTESTNKTPLKAVSYFHTTAEQWNCAQSIIKSRQDIVGMDDAAIETQFRPKGGGRAEGGICGALYAAIQMLPQESAERIKNKVEERFGATTCKGLKVMQRIPCTTIVSYVDELIAEEQAAGAAIHTPSE